MLQSDVVTIRQIARGRALKELARRAQMDPAQATVLGLDFEGTVTSEALDGAFVVFLVDIIKVDVMTA